MDWGLPQNIGEVSGPAARSSPAFFKFTLRDKQLVSRRKLTYVLLCIFNFVLRFLWTLSAFGRVSSHGAGMFFFEFMEILRRTVWAVFRIEWEVIVKDRRFLSVSSSDSKRHSPEASDADDVYEAEMVPLKLGKEMSSFG